MKFKRSFSDTIQAAVIEPINYLKREFNDNFSI